MFHREKGFYVSLACAALAVVALGAVCYKVASPEEDKQSVASEEIARRCDERGSFSCSVKLRYRQAAVPCRLALGVPGSVRVVLDSPQTTTAPGQYAVFYDEGVVIGGGVIEQTMRD